MSEELNSIEEFRSSPKLRESLIQHGTLKRYVKGAAIMNENSLIRSIPIVMSGALRVTRTEEDGREITLYYLKAGESCVMSFLGGMHNDTSKVKVEVEDDAEILFLPMDKVHLFIKEFPQWLDYIFKLYHRRFEELLDVVNAIAFKKVDERMLSLLQKKVDLSGSRTLNVTHEQLANELGTVRVVVSRLLKQLEDNGTVELGRNKITLV
jgi:CRP/FNR family transcriptional regulator